MYVVLSLLPSTDLDRRVPSQVKSNLLYAVYNHFLDDVHDGICTICARWATVAEEAKAFELATDMFK